MSEYKFFRVETEGHIAKVAMNNPQKSNALGAAFWRELKPLMRELHCREDVRAVLFYGEGKGFSSGMDFQEMAKEMPGFLESKRCSDDLFIEAIHELQEAVNSISACRKPIIAVIHGYCIGAALDIALACDIRIGSKEAYFQAKEVAMAVIPDMGLIERLPLCVGEGVARELVFTARKISAEKALELRLLNRLSENLEEAFKAAKEIADEIAENSPIAVQAAKKSFYNKDIERIEANMRFAAQLNAKIIPSGDLIEAMTALMQKRKPEFKGK